MADMQLASSARAPLVEAVLKHDLKLAAYLYQATRLHDFAFLSRMLSQSSPSALYSVLFRTLIKMNTMYRHLSSNTPDQHFQGQEHQSSDVPSLQAPDYEALIPDNMLRRASPVPSSIRSTHVSNTSLRSPILSTASHASTDRTVSESVDPPQAAPRQQQSTTPNVKEAKYNDGKRTTWSLLQKRQWKFETCLLFLSVCSLVAIIILLAVEDGTTLASWKFYFSLNTVVSVLGTISRASFASSVGSCIAQEKWNWFRKRQDPLYLFDRFDSASRGPLGSLRLLYWLEFW